MDTFQRTSLAVSWAGPSPSEWPGGQTIDQCGPGRALVRAAPMRGSNEDSMTSVTSGPTGSGSSASATLQSFLGSRSIALLEGSGSTLFSLTWKEKTTPAGRRYSLLRASARPMGGTESTSWLSPTKDDAGRQGSAEWAAQWGQGVPTTQQRLRTQVLTVGQPSHWTTPTATDQHATWEQLRARQARAALNGRHIGVLLDMQAQLASWPTPTSTVADKAVRSLDGAIKEAERKGWNNDLNTAALSAWPTPTSARQVTSPEAAAEIARTGNVENSLGVAVQMVGWPTPRASDENNSNNGWDVIQRRIADGRATVPEMVQGMLSSWGTPTSRDWKDGDCSHLGLPVKGLVSRQVLGATSSGSSAPTEKGGQLNPAFVRWLMGYPEGWECFAGLATRSSRPWRQRSSAPPQERSVTPSVSVFSRTGMVCR